MLDVRRLRVLREVAAHGSFSAAAEALSYTQSAVSQQIAALEREAGSRLVERNARGVTLTDAGPRAGRPRRRRSSRAWPTPRTSCRRSPACAAAACASRPSRAPARRSMPLAVAPLPRAPSRASSCRCCPAEPDEALRLLRGGRVRHRAVDRADLRRRAPSRRPRHCRRCSTTPCTSCCRRDHPLAGRARLRLTDLADEPWMIGTTGHLPGRAASSCAPARPRASSRSIAFHIGRLPRDPGLRRGRDGRLVHPRPRAGRRARRRRRPLARRRGRRCAASSPRRWPTRSARRPSRRCSTCSSRSPTSSARAARSWRWRPELAARTSSLSVTRRTR